MIAGELPPAQLRLVISWSARHRAELEANWDRARLGQHLEAIDPSPNLLNVTDVPPLYDITGVAVIGDHKLRLLFEDGTVGDISFEAHDWRGVFEPLRDPARFAKVKIQYGTIVWPDYDLGMAPEPLYQAAREHALAPAHSAR